MEILPVLIVAQPGRTRDGLQALLKAIAQLQIVGLAKDIQSAPQLAVEHHPELVLLDSSACNGSVPETVRQIKAQWPRARYLVLVSNDRQQQEARAAGADGVLLKGFSTARFVEMVDRLVAADIRQRARSR